ncbi:hypothetical protein GQ54DRAFT_313030 [Martensiomyces pterosporus]|nr:hypothetical protein GQ54DRAFT_313030 [Martensiomyces pterosporus]
MDAERVFMSFTQTADLTSKAQRELLSIYLMLTSTVASSIIGYYVADRVPFVGSGGLLTVLGILATTLAIFMLPPTSENLNKRRSLLWLDGWLTGASLRPLILQFFYWDDAALVYAALGSALVLFASFALGVLSSNRRQVIYLLGSISFAVCTFGWVSLVNFFYPTSTLISLELLLGLASSCGYVIMHTQLMLDEVNMGLAVDPVRHSLTFFNDLVELFVRLLVILANNKQRRESEEESDRDRRRRRNQARTGAASYSSRSKVY